MHINSFGSKSANTEKKVDTSSFVQKPYLRTKYIKSIIEEDMDMKNLLKINILPGPMTVREAASKYFVDSKLNDPSLLKKQRTC